MKFSVSQNSLQNALSVVLKGISTKTTTPILSGIFIETKGEFLVLQTTNLDLSIQYQIEAFIEEPGKAVFPGKLFSDIVKSMNESHVYVETHDSTALLLCDSSSFTIRTLDANDFPSFPQVEILKKITIPFSTFGDMVKKVARSSSKDSSKPVFTGINVTLEGNILSMVTTDSYRLALTSCPIKTDFSEDFQAVISSSFMTDIASLPKTSEDITLALTDNQIVISYQDTVFINRKIEGSYPAYKRIIPDEHVTRIAIPKQQLITAVHRASLLSNANSPVKFEIDVSSGTLQLSSIQDAGSLKETLPIQGEGDNIEIGFNCSYITDGLSSIDDERVFLEVTASAKSGVFKTEGECSFLYLVMPRRV